MRFQITYILILLSFCISGQQKQEENEKLKALKASRDLTWEANKELSDNNFQQAEADYRRAISKSEENVVAPYNLGNAYYEKETYTEAFGRFKQAGELATAKPDKHKAFHNMGNVFMKNKEYAKAVEAYKEALRNTPTDEETRYNLALAKELLKKEQDEQKKDGEDENEDQQDQKDQNEDKEDQGDNKEDKGEPKDDENKNKGDQGDEKEEENKEDEGDEKEEQKKQPEQGNSSEQPQQPRPNQLSPQQIENLLEAMQNEEKKVKEKIDAQKVKGPKLKNKKDW